MSRDGARRAIFAAIATLERDGYRGEALEILRRAVGARHGCRECGATFRYPGERDEHERRSHGDDV